MYFSSRAFLQTADRLIPGYQRLSEEEREAFQQTDAGEKLAAAVEEILAGVEQASRKLWWFQKALFSASTNYRDVSVSIKEKRKQLQREFSQSEAYQQIIHQIICSLLVSEYPDMGLLNDKQINHIAKADYSKALYDILLCDETDPQRAHIIYEWKNDFSADERMAQCRSHIIHKKDKMRQRTVFPMVEELNGRLHLLKEFFPLPNLKTFYKPKELLQWRTLPSIDQIEEILLTNAIFTCLQSACERFDFDQIEVMNRRQANILAKKVLEAFNKKSSAPNLEQWLPEYQAKLAGCLKEELFLINGKKWESPNESRQLIADSLSSLWNNRAVHNARDFITRLADAHAFLQSTGFATQNESSSLAFFDLWNYGRLADRLHENKTIISTLLSPFKPIYDEYRAIGLYEKNRLSIFIRAAMPLVIISAVVFAVSFLLVPFALPELTFAFLLIPTLFAALGVASVYTAVKNYVYEKARQFYYGGAFEIPEFQVSERMEIAFGSRRRAETVRNFYIDEFKRCEAKEASYQSKASLSAQELTAREANTNRRRSLWLEWYDIHSNTKLGHDELLSQIVLKRLREVTNTSFETMQRVFTDQDITRISTDTARLACRKMAPDNLAFESNADAEDPRYTPRLFREQRNKASRIDRIADTFSAQPAN